MSNVKYILTADDYGPVDFINKGILKHVASGSINSVQVLTNFDQTELNKQINLLWNTVPTGKTVVLDFT